MLIKCVISSLKREEREVRQVNCNLRRRTAPHLRENNIEGLRFFVSFIIVRKHCSVFLFNTGLHLYLVFEKTRPNYQVTERKATKKSRKTDALEQKKVVDNVMFFD